MGTASRPCIRRLGLLLLSAGVTTRTPPAPVAPLAPMAPQPWDARLAQLQHATQWRLDGRAAVAIGTQGWQASLSWNQDEDVSDAHLAGPLGVGAQVLRLSPAGLLVNGAPADAAALEALQARVGFELPLRELRYWLLGVPEPGAPATLELNGMDRAAHLEQAGWNVDFERYMVVVGDRLPQRLVLTHAAVRVRIVIDHWELGQ